MTTETKPETILAEQAQPEPNPDDALPAEEIAHKTFEHTFGMSPRMCAFIPHESASMTAFMAWFLARMADARTAQLLYRAAYSHGGITFTRELHEYHMRVNPRAGVSRVMMGKVESMHAGAVRKIEAERAVRAMEAEKEAAREAAGEGKDSKGSGKRGRGKGE